MGVENLAPHQDLNPRLSSQWRVAILTALSWPTIITTVVVVVVELAAAAVLVCRHISNIDTTGTPFQSSHITGSHSSQLKWVPLSYKVQQDIKVIQDGEVFNGS
jgi:hypothetical protein